MKSITPIFLSIICLALVFTVAALALPIPVAVIESSLEEMTAASLFEEASVEAHTHKICGVSFCTDENHTGHTSDIVYTPITQASTVDGVTVTMSGTSYNFVLAAGTADAPKTYNFYVDEDITVASAITVPSYTTLNLCLNGKVINCNSYDFLLTTSSGNTDINLCDCSEGVIHHGYLGELGTTGRLLWMQGEEVPEGYTELDLEGGVIDGYDTSTTSSSYSNKALVNLAALTSQDTPVTFNMYGGNLAGHYRYGVAADKYTTFNFHNGRIVGNRMGIVTRTTGSVGATVNMYGGVVSHHVGDSYCGAAITAESTFNLYGGEICYNENYGTGTSRGAGINNFGIINMYGGSLHHNYSDSDGGAIYNNGDINMYGGSMTYNSAYMGAAVYNYGGSSNGGFYMSGGTITQNISLSKNNFSRGAIWLRPGDPSTMFGGGGTFVVSGKPVVYDNFDVLGRQANIFVGTSQWEGKTRISVGALEEGARLGVFAYDTDGPVTYNWTQSMADANPNDYFLSDENPQYNKILVDETSGEVYIDGCEHDGEKVYEGTTGSFHLVTCGICKDVFDQDHTETTPADCLNLAYCEVCNTSYGSVSTSNHHESCTVSYTYENGSYHTVSWDKCEYTSRARHTKTTAANCTNPNYCGVCKSNYGGIAKGQHVEDENHNCTICKATACATVLLDGETEPTYYIELDAAFDAVEDKATITLLRDVDELLSGCYVNDGDDITLDFNGHNITLSSSYYFNVTKSKKTDYDFARLTVVGSGKITYNRAGSKYNVYSPFLVSAQQNSAGTGAGYPELIIGGNIIVETTGDYAAAVKVESNNPAVTSHFTLKDNAKLISNYANGAVHYGEPASSGIQGGVNIFIEGGSLVNNAGTTLVGYNESSNYYDGSLATVYIDVPDVVSNIPDTYYLISPNFEDKYGTVDFTAGNTVVNKKNYALENTAVSFTVAPSERFTLTSVSANNTALTAADGVYSFTMPAGVATVTATFESKGHFHPVCGDTHTDIGDHKGECEDIEWTAWSGDSITFGTGYYYLTRDVDTSVLVASDSDVHLCLNGYTLTSTEGESAVYVPGGSSFTLTDCVGTGKLTGGTGTDPWGSDNYRGGGICSGSDGIVTVFGGNITGNCADTYGAGIYTDGNLYLYGGSVTGNSFNDEQANTIDKSQVYASNLFLFGGSFDSVKCWYVILGGSPEISGFLRTYGEGLKISYELTNTSPIPLFCEEASYRDDTIKIGSGYGGYADKFETYEEYAEIKNENGELVFIPPVRIIFYSNDWSERVYEETLPTGGGKLTYIPEISSREGYAAFWDPITDGAPTPSLETVYTESAEYIANYEPYTIELEKLSEGYRVSSPNGTIKEDGIAWYNATHNGFAVNLDNAEPFTSDDASSSYENGKWIPGNAYYFITNLKAGDVLTVTPDDMSNFAYPQLVASASYHMPKYTVYNTYIEYKIDKDGEYELYSYDSSWNYSTTPVSATVDTYEISEAIEGETTDTFKNGENGKYYVVKAEFSDGTILTSNAFLYQTAIQIDLGERSDETNIRYAEIGGVVTAVVEDGDKYFVEIGEENLLIEFVEKTAEGEFVKSQYFYVDMTEGKATHLNLDSYMTTDGKKSIRTKTPMGIRFRSTITDTARQEDTAFVIDEYGYIIALEEHLNGEELTFDFSRHVTGVAYNKADGTDVVYSQNDGVTTFTGVLHGIPAAKYKTNIVSKTYTKITVGGEQFVLYGEAVTGNVYDTAQTLLSKEDIDEETRSALSQIILDYENEAGFDYGELVTQE